MSDDQGAPRFDQAVDERPLGRPCVDSRSPSQVERVVGDQQIRTSRDCLFDDGRNRIDGEGDHSNPGVRVATDRADGIPVGCRVRWVQHVEYSHYVRHGDHEESGYRASYAESDQANPQAELRNVDPSR